MNATLACLLLSGTVLLLSRFFTLPWSYHPLRFLEWFAQRLAGKVHRDPTRPAEQQQLAGTLALLLFLLIPLALWYGLYLMSAWPLLLDAIFMLGSLAWPHYRHHALQLGQALQKQQLSLARQHASRFMLRDCRELSPMGLTKASLEALALRFNQQITAMVLWYLLAGTPGLLLCRLSQIASQQWSVKLPDNRYFGLAASRLNQFFDWPAYLLGAGYCRLQCSRGSQPAQVQTYSEVYPALKRLLLAQQSRLLRVSLGGPVIYQQQRIRYPRLQQKNDPAPGDIQRWLRLLDYQLFTYILIMLITSFMLGISQA